MRGDDGFVAAAAIRKRIGKALNQTYADTSPAPHPPSLAGEMSKNLAIPGTTAIKTE